jgi:hypothetical protein
MSIFMKGIVVVTFLAIFAMLFGVMELAARLYVMHGLKIADQDFTHFYRFDPDLRLLTWGDRHHRHPYLGYVNSRMDELAGLRDNHDNSQYVIAILGGSVAEHFAEYAIDHPQYFDRLRQVIPEIGDRTIHIVDLAVGGYKQPQQFIVASYFLGDFDMTVNIDGLNEIVLPDLDPVYPTDYPHFTLRLYAKDGFSLSPLLVYSLTFAYKTMNAVPLRVPILATSRLYFVTWQGVRGILYWGIRRLERRYLAAIGIEAPQGQDERWAASKSRQIGIWKKYIRLQRQVESSRGIPAYFFLQPNQYLKGSKPLSPEERATAINAEVADIKDAEIRLLRAAAQDLTSEGVPVFDLTGLFHETPATVYVDACCHMNERGNQIMARHIVSVLAEQAMTNHARR